MGWLGAELSVVIPSHRRTDLLARCLASLAEHAPPNCEIIVVDDGSSGECVTRTAEQFAESIPRLICPRHPMARGFAASANAGVRLASAPVVQLLNDDAFVAADWYRGPLELFADPDLAAVAPLVLRDDGSGRIDSAGDEYDSGGFARPRGMGLLWRDGLFPRGFIDAASASAAFYSADWFRKVGGFDEGFGSYFEDVDLSLRLRKSGGNIVFEPGSVAWHRRGASFGRPNRSLVRSQSRNEELLFRRHSRSHRARHAAVLLLKGLRRLREGTLWPWIRGRFDARRLPRLPALPGEAGAEIRA